MCWPQDAMQAVTSCFARWFHCASTSSRQSMMEPSLGHGSDSPELNFCGHLLSSSPSPPHLHIRPVGWHIKARDLMNWTKEKTLLRGFLVWFFCLFFTFVAFLHRFQRGFTYFLWHCPQQCLWDCYPQGGIQVQERGRDWLEITQLSVALPGTALGHRLSVPNSISCLKLDSFANPAF